MEDNKTNLTKEQAIQAMREGKKVRHRYFSDNEWMTMSEGKILLEDGVRVGWLEFWSLRSTPEWDIDYSIISEKKSEDNKTKEEILREAANNYVSNHTDMEVRRMYGHHLRSFKDGWNAHESYSQQSTKHLQDEIVELRRREAILTNLIVAEWGKDIERYPLPICFYSNEEQRELYRRTQQIERDIKELLNTKS